MGPRRYQPKRRLRSGRGCLAAAVKRPTVIVTLALGRARSVAEGVNRAVARLLGTVAGVPGVG
jgi:hypothetical protein